MCTVIAQVVPQVQQTSRTLSAKGHWTRIVHGSRDGLDVVNQRGVLAGGCIALPANHKQYNLVFCQLCGNSTEALKLERWFLVSIVIQVVFIKLIALHCYNPFLVKIEIRQLLLIAGMSQANSIIKIILYMCIL